LPKQEKGCIINFTMDETEPLAEEEKKVGFWKRISYAFRSLFSILWRCRIPEDIAQALIATPPFGTPHPVLLPEDKGPGDSADRAVQMLAILQRDGRLIDFFIEDITPYSDTQIGAAVRNLHQSCREAVERYIALEPIIAADEGNTVTVSDDIDPSEIKLVGNVAGSPPWHGLLRHRGWRVKAMNLPPLPEGTSRSVIAQAEVEIP
jgi:Domain of unknown function (DUF2760)